MKALIKLKKDSPYHEKKMVVNNLTEIHYSYPSGLNHKSTAFESDIDHTGFTIRNDYIEEFEITK